VARYKCVDEIFRVFNTHENTHKIPSTYCTECHDVIHLWENTESQEEHSKVRGLCKDHICTTGRIPKLLEDMKEYAKKYLEIKHKYLELKAECARLEKLTEERWEVHSKMQRFRERYFDIKKKLGLKEKK
jgi:hypothetical protein